MVKKPINKKKSDYHEFILGMRDQINRRVNQASSKFPNYRLEAIKVGFERCFHNLFNANAQNPQTNFAEIFDAIFNLFLLAVGQNYYTGSETRIRDPHIDPLFDQVFPNCVPLLNQSPHSIPAMLFNTCEYVGERATSFINAFNHFILHVNEANLEKFIQILLWWLGDPRRRQIALENLGELPENVQSEIFTFYTKTQCNPSLVSGAIQAMKQDPWIHPAEYFNCNRELSSKPGEPKKSTPITGSICRIRYGAFVGFKGIYDSPPKVAGNVDDYLITYTATGRLFYSKLDCFGAWEKSIPILPCTKVVHPTRDACFGITLAGQLYNLRSGKEIFINRVKGCIDLFANNQLLFVIAKSAKLKEVLLRFHLDWAKNPIQTSKKTNKDFIDPISIIELPPQSGQVVPFPNKPSAFLIAHQNANQSYQLTRLEVNQNFEPIESTIILEQKSAFFFSLQGDACHILLSDGTYARYNEDCSHQDLKVKFPGLTRPTSLFIHNNDVFATSSHSFHVFGFLRRAPGTGVPAENAILQEGG